MNDNDEVERWVRTLPAMLTGDPVWRMEAYRIASYVVHLSWPDVSALAKQPITRQLAQQLYDALDSIPSHIGEGYSRSSGRDRVRLYEYALGSTRECISRYSSSIPVIGEETARHRQSHLRSVVRLLSAMIPHERRRRIAEG